MSTVKNKALKDIKQKALMSLFGMIVLVYVLFHSLSSLAFFSGESAFNNLYIWLNSGWFFAYFVPGLLVLALLYHMFIAIQKQLSNATKVSSYAKPYPKAVPRLIAWSGVVVLFSFIVIHIYQMQNIDMNNSYNEIADIFKNPLFVAIYVLATITLIAHLWHGLNNVGQTFGCNTKPSISTLSIVLFLLGFGFIAIPLFTYFIL